MRMKMNKIAVLVYVVLTLLTKFLGFAFSVLIVLWLLGLFNIAGNTVLALFVLSILSSVLTAGLAGMIKAGAL